jgi:hypothetical protein
MYICAYTYVYIRCSSSTIMVEKNSTDIHIICINGVSIWPKCYRWLGSSLPLTGSPVVALCVLKRWYTLQPRTSTLHQTGSAVRWMPSLLNFLMRLGCRVSKHLRKLGNLPGKFISHSIGIKLISSLNIFRFYVLKPQSKKFLIAPVSFRQIEI